MLRFWFGFEEGVDETLLRHYRISSLGSGVLKSPETLKTKGGSSDDDSTA